MSESQFHIAILDQGWIDPSVEKDDLYSHGHIHLRIGDKVVSDGKEDHGIIDSGLALLRTLGSDHTPAHPVANRLIFHGCAIVPMMSCPIGVNWDVVHRANYVHISNVVVFPSITQSDAVYFDGLSFEMPFDEYRAEIVGFAVEAKSLYDGTSKNLEDITDEEQYKLFWQEYDQLLTKYPGGS